MKSRATNIKEYLAELPEDRRKAIKIVRDVILKNLPKGYEEILQNGAIGYVVPHSIYPAGYHCDPKQPLPYVGLASQKNHMAIYMMCIYSDPDQEKWFRDAWTKTGLKLDMGKSCVRFKKIEDVPLDVVGKAIKRVPVKKFIDFYEKIINTTLKSRTKKKRSTKSTKKKVDKSNTRRSTTTATKKVGKSRKKSASKSGR